MQSSRSLYFPYTGQLGQNVPTMNNREDLCTPAAQGLYDPSTERDACGIGFVVHMKGRKSHTIVEKALQVLINLEHRGACGCEANTGDGAGILVQMPGVEPEQAASIRETLEKVAKLELREVSPRSEEPDAEGKSLAQRVMDGVEIVPGYRAYNYTQKDEDGVETTRPILLNRRMALGGSDIANAVPSPHA